MNDYPKVSVCLPNYNYASFLQPCIDSVLEQTFSDFELLVVDDASDDDSVQIVQAYRDPRIRFHRHSRRLGAVPTWNHCLELARGEYLAFLCADDFFLSDKLRCQVEVLAADPAVGLVHTGGYWADESAEKESLFSAVFPADLQRYLSADRCSAAPEELRSLAGGYNYIHLSSAMFRRCCVDEQGRFSEHFPYAADWDLWLRIAAHYGVTYLACPLAVYRRHGRNLTRDMQASGQDLRDWYGVTVAAFRSWPVAAGDPRQVRRTAYQVIREHLVAKVQAEYARGDNRAVRRDLHTGFAHDRCVLLGGMGLYVKSWLGGRTTKRRLQGWLGRRSDRGDEPDDGTGTGA